MPRWLLVALTLVAFTLAMTAWGWVVGASVPVVDTWLVGLLGQWGATILVAALILGGAIYAYRGGRKPNGT